MHTENVVSILLSITTLLKLAFEPKIITNNMVELKKLFIATLLFQPELTKACNFVIYSFIKG